MMKRVLQASVVAVGLMMSVGGYASVGTVDMAKVFSSSAKAKAIRTQLEAKFSAKRDALQAKAEKIQAEATKYEKNKTIMKKAERESVEKQLAKDEAQLRNERMAMQRALFSEQGEMTKKMFADVKNVIAKIAKQKHLTMVMPNNAILFSNDDSDITGDVIDRLK